MPLIHGGQLLKVAEQYKIPAANWLDLSTGIAPLSYPIPNIELSTWQQLPQESAALITAAKHYYQCDNLVVTNGSQAIIKALPSLYTQEQHNPETATHNNDTIVYLPSRGYKEHAQAWQKSHYCLHFYPDELPALNTLTRNCVVVIINPNNPTGKFFNWEVIKAYHQALKALNGLLVVDEAFMDIMPKSQSSCGLVNDKHLIVFRSFGKFFGLAGIRIGFLVANDYWCKKLNELLGCWQVNGPAQVVAQHALSDTAWHKTQCDNLRQLRLAQEQMLSHAFTNKLIKAMHGCDLFITLSFHNQAHAKQLYHLLCLQGVYCRLADEQDTLRFGIALTDQLPRLQQACESAYNEIKNTK